MVSYIPIIRPGPVELNALSEFWSGLTRFAAGSDHSFSPLIEIIDEEGLSDLDKYLGFGDLLLVDYPLYLQERRTKFSGGLGNLEKEYENSVDFFQEEIDQAVPVVSTDSIDLIEYDTILSDFNSLREEFDRIALRPFVGGPELDTEQKSSLRNLINEIRSNDLILLDVVDVAGFEGSLYENIVFINDLISNNDTFVLNAFEPRQRGHAHNHGPILTEDLNLDGFGDFVLEPRYPPAGGQPTDTRIIRHYSPNEFELEIFISEEGGYEEAFEQLKSSDYWNSEHCQYCQEASTDWNESHRFWKKIRMGHYLHSSFLDTLQEMDEHTGQDLDMDGYQYIHSRVEE